MTKRTSCKREGSAGETHASSRSAALLFQPMDEIGGIDEPRKTNTKTTITQTAGAIRPGVPSQVDLSSMANHPSGLTDGTRVGCRDDHAGQSAAKGLYLLCASSISRAVSRLLIRKLLQCQRLQLWSGRHVVDPGRWANSGAGVKLVMPRCYIAVMRRGGHRQSIPHCAMVTSLNGYDRTGCRPECDFAGSLSKPATILVL